MDENPCASCQLLHCLNRAPNLRVCPGLPKKEQKSNSVEFLTIRNFPEPADLPLWYALKVWAYVQARIAIPPKLQG